LDGPDQQQNKPKLCSITQSFCVPVPILKTEVSHIFGEAKGIFGVSMGKDGCKRDG
jgi:energy-converting hydrogenase Eha subunit A